MTYFESGFLNQASEYGMSEKTASRILKRALEHDEAHQLFKSLPEYSSEDSADEDVHPDDLEALKEMLRQDFIDRHMSAAQHRIQL